MNVKFIFPVFSFFLAFLFFSTSAVFAQEAIGCGSTPYTEQLKQQYPDVEHNMELIEQHTEQYINNLAHQPQTERVVYTIPVVFHVVYNTTAENISDAQIQSQLTALNRDFRKLNTDASTIPSAFSALAADVEIEFCLAQRDPSNNITTGITRTFTNQTSFGVSGGITYSSQGGKDIWDRSKYLNIYICDLSPAGLGGYAQLPGGPAATDAVVIDYSVLGTTGGVSYPYNQGRTTVHEVGHWFNLLHIWGDSNCGNDLVSDTPTQQTNNTACPNFPHISCSNGPNGDMFMSHMDYTYDICRKMFSVGQKNRMRAVLASGGARAGLLNSLGCVSPISANCATPTNLTTTNITTTSARFNWTAVSGANSYNIQGRKVGAATWTSLSSNTNYKQLGTVLQACKNYQWQVQSVCSGGVSAYSSPISFTSACAMQTPETPAPSNNTEISALNMELNNLFLLPNPAQNYLTISFGAATDLNTYVYVYDLNGKQQLSIPVLAKQGFNELQVDLSQLANGYYMVALDNGATQLREKLVVIK